MAHPLHNEQDDGWVIMKGFVQWNLVYGRKDFRLKRGSNPGLLDQLLNPLSYRDPHMYLMPIHVAQSVARPTQEPEVPGFSTQKEITSQTD